MTSKIYAECMSSLQSVFGAISEERFLALNRATCEMSDIDFMAATHKIIKTFSPTSTKPFPVPSDFYTAAGDSPEHKAEKAMYLISTSIPRIGAYQSVDFGDGVIHSVISRSGGWVAICGWTQEEWSINEGRIKAALIHGYATGDYCTDTHVVGLIERHNGLDEKNVICIGSKRTHAIEDKRGTRERNGFARISEIN